MNKRFLKGLLVSIAFSQGVFMAQANQEENQTATAEEAATATQEEASAKPAKKKKQAFHDGNSLMEKVVRISKMGELKCPLSPAEQQKEAMRLVRLVIQRTLENSANLKSKREAYWKNYGGLALARGEFLPDLGVEFGAELKRKRSDETKIDESTTPHRIKGSGEGNVRAESAAASLKLSQNLFNGGGSLARVRQARLSNKVAYEEYRTVESKDLFDHIKVMLQVINDMILIQHRRADVAINEEFLKTEFEKMKVGEIDRSEVALNQSKLEKAKMKLNRALIEFEEHKGDLERWTGLKPEDLIPVLPVFDVFLPKNEAEAEKIAEAHNPTLRRNHYAALLKKAEITVKKTGGSPKLDLTASAGASTGHEHNKARANGGWKDHNLSERSGTDLAVGLRFSMPLDIKGTVRTNVGGAHHDYVATVAAGNKEHSDVMSAISTDWENLKRAKATIEASERYLQANFVMLQGTLQELAVGAKVYTQVLKAQSDYMEAQEYLLKDQLEYALTILRLLLNTGKLDARTFGVTEFSDPLVASAYPEIAEAAQTRSEKKKEVQPAPQPAQKEVITPVTLEAKPGAPAATAPERPSFKTVEAKPVVDGPKAKKRARHAKPAPETKSAASAE